MSKYPQRYRPFVSYLSILLIIFVLALLIRENDLELVVPEPVFEPVAEIFIEEQDIPDFSTMMDVQVKKDSFFSFLTPYVDAVNGQILQQRQRLEFLKGKVLSGRSLTRSEMGFVSELRIEYELENEMLNTLNLLNRLLKRADIIPQSLALAQAANESAWGTSRFAQEGNNFFGQWCYTEGCGIVPSRRPEGANHEVKSFDTVLDSVESYIMNLNTFPSYQHLRDIRQELRDQGEALDGITLSEGLDSYSERGDEYIEELQTMIYSNNLLVLDSRDA